MLTVTTAATDLTLLGVEERRVAVGVDGNSRDAELATLEARVAAMIAAVCRVAAAGTTMPTLRAETLTEVFRLTTARKELILARRPIISITSVTEDSTAVDAADYESEAGAGLVRRLSSDTQTDWSASKITIVYQAGWATVPDDLKLAAAKFMLAEWQQKGRDPLLMSKRTEGVAEYRWWVDPTRDSVVPADVLDILERGGYVNHWLG